MFIRKIIFYLPLLCGTVLCDGGVLAKRNGASTTASAVRPLLKGCDFGNSGESNAETGACVKKSLCLVIDKEGSNEATTAHPDTSFTSSNSDSPTFPFDVEEIDVDNPGCDENLEVCCILSNVLLEPKAKPTVTPTGCGFSSPATYSEFPWMVALMNNEDGAANRHIGGGTIIHPSVVMTVAHKVEKSKPNQLICRAGELNLSANTEVYKLQERSVSIIIIHAEYISVNMQYGVALLVLSSPFDLTNAPHIGVACLEPHMPRPGTICYGMGWGQDDEGKPQTDVLKKLTLPLVDHNRCENLLLKGRVSNYSLHHTLMCAGGEENVDTCFGYGGSSLVCPIGDGDKTRYSVVGMIGYGLSKACGKKEEPRFYIKVPAIYDWIVNEMSYLSLNSSTFVY